MNIVFLRGAIPPQNEHPEKIEYDHIDVCEDMWTQLFHAITHQLDANAIMLYQGGDRIKRVDDKFVERWVPNLGKYALPMDPDIIFARGGFDYYDPFLRRFPRAKKVYYGAGRRFFPQYDFKDYDLFLVDSEKQRSKVRAMFKIPVKLFVKPAATLFQPIDVEKKYDVCFMANAQQEQIKGHRFFIKQVANSGLSVLNLGNTKQELVMLARDIGADITWGGWTLRKELPERISQCRVGVTCSERGIDSCPRVIPEYLACGLPIVVTSDVHFWHEVYVNKNTGKLVGRKDFLGAIKRVLAVSNNYDTRAYYDQYLSLDVASTALANLIRRMAGGWS